MPEFDRSIKARCDMLREKYGYRDAAGAITLAVRRGDWDAVDRDAFSDAHPRPIVANRIDVQSRILAAALSPMPAIRCRATSMEASDRAKTRADKRTKIVNHYFTNARFPSQMQIGADQLGTFGMIVTQVTPDFEEQMPVPLCRDSLGVYPVWDARGRTKEVALVFRRRIVDLQAEFPEVAIALDDYRSQRGADAAASGMDVEVTIHDDGKFITMLAPQVGEGLVLSRVPNPVGCCTFVCTKRPTIDGRIRGAWDDLVWVQLASNEMQMLTLEAATKAVEAPIAAPNDVVNIAYGPDAIIRSQSPEKIRRVSLDVPAAAFAAVEHFKQEMNYGAIIPEAMSGNLDASVVTGRGVQELMAGYSQQVALLQETLSFHLEQVSKICFKMDEALWPDVRKHITGTKDGSPYDVRYVPREDIAGDHVIDVNYGTSTGLDKNRHMVYLLQGQAAGLFSADTVTRELPGQIDATAEQHKIQVEQGRAAIVAAVAGMAQAIPQIVGEGGDASEIVAKIAKFVNQVEKGKPIEDVAEAIFPPPPPPPTPTPMPGAEGLAPEAAAMAGQVPDTGLAGSGVTVEGDGGAPDVAQFFSGLTSDGNPNLGAYVSRRAPAA